MEEEKAFDLSTFMPDSLYEPFGTHTKQSFPTAIEDSLQKLFAQDPFELLGEKTFREVEIPAGIGTPIQEFFRGANVFITGGTGFIGKGLIEKLIRSIPNLGHVYILVRPKRGKSCNERFDQLLEDKLFRRMKAEVPLYHSKITALEGDISAPDLGLSAEDRQLLSDKINVVFHSAADVSFVEPLRKAISSNVLGSRRVLHLARTMNSLKCFVHVSTAYSNCVRRVVEERCYKMNRPYTEILKLIESKTDAEIEEDLRRILQGWPNTYTFSKAVCEAMLEEEGRGLPLCIYRPSIVCPTYQEPFKGWTDNLNGPVGMMVAVGMGLIHTFRLDPGMSIDMVPVDYVVNSMIAVAWQTAMQTNKETLAVFNFTSQNSPCWKAFIKWGYCHKDMYPSTRALWYLSLNTTESRTLDNLLHFFLHKIPGLVVDKTLEILGSKSSFSLTRIYDKIHVLKSELDFFLFHKWEFSNENMLSLWCGMTKEDKLMFNFDTSDIDYEKYLLLIKVGSRYYFLKEDMESLPASNQKFKRLKWAHYSLLTLSGFFTLKLMVLIAQTLPL